MTLSKRAVLNPKQQSKHSKTSQSQSRFLPGLTAYRDGFFGGGWEKGESGGGSKQDEIDSVQITTIQ